ncbi:MAG TPA: hypothetical protein VFG87_19130 [Amycolatopsis sp.]|jgi:hypothetical protein|nr:hypothetical protein [Amycolatopsis sp.]
MPTDPLLFPVTASEQPGRPVPPPRVRDIMVTPFTVAEEVDVESRRAVTRRVADAGVVGGVGLRGKLLTERDVIAGPTARHPVAAGGPRSRGELRGLVGRSSAGAPRTAAGARR